MYASSVSSPSHHPSSFPARLPSRQAGPRLSNRPSSIQSGASRRRACGREYSGGGLVDQSMIVLRKRIHEMKMAESNYEAPSEWMDWEKRYYTSYHADVCEILCLLQTLLMGTRPSVAIGMMAVLVLSVPTSAIFISFHLIAAVNSILAGTHLS
ncbi:hypothetical protein OPV22_016444 [Ensete ventricosum]|uniref:Mediator of RNA polymerase II transcription subunit n=1 Tax=Ensete ventricosum TaxID=4639 RepID=A0AAV8QZS8_ENSVE|nr:hypothetical protein OPV22_016444 [Ensete ventricosum]